MIVVGIDPSLTSPGIAIVRDGVLVATGNPKSKGKKSDTLMDRTLRLRGLARKISDIALWSHAELPALVVIENPSYGSKFGSPHDRSGLWWSLVQHMYSFDIPVATVAPQGRAKYATGKGGAAKDVVGAHVVERYTNDYVAFGRNHDVADAAVLAAMGSRHLGKPLACEAGIPDVNLEAMEGAAWPL